MSFITDFQEFGVLVQKTGDKKLFEEYMKLLDKAVDINVETMRLSEENGSLKEKLKIQGKVHQGKVYRN